MVVMPEALRVFAEAVGGAMGLTQYDAERLAGWLIECDLRGVNSHGTMQLPRYASEIKSGGINARPDVRCVNETPVSVTVDGDGGLGYFPADEGTRRTIDKAQQQGMAAMVCRNHGHIGAAGLYTRMAAEADLLCFATSGVQLSLGPQWEYHRAAGGSPMSFSAPGMDGPALILDVGVTHGVQGPAGPREALAAVAPTVVLRMVGLGTVCQAWGGLLAGLSMDPPTDPKHRAANQGMFLFACKVSLFAEVEEYKKQIDTFAQQVRELQPMPGSEGAFLPGHVEAHREATYRRDGVPLSADHRAALEKLAEELGVALPW